MRLRFTLIAAATLSVAACTFLATTSSSQAAAIVGTPTIGIGGKCVDITGDEVGSNGAAVQLWDCQSYAAEQRHRQRQRRHRRLRQPRPRRPQQPDPRLRHQRQLLRLAPGTDSNVIYSARLHWR